MYSRVDTLLSHLKKYIRNEFNRMGLMGLDELNVITVKTQTTSLFDRLKEENMKAFRDAAKNAQSYALKLITLYRGDEFSADISTEELESLLKKKSAVDTSELTESPEIGTVTWVTGFLALYNPITCYLYTSEADRKRMRYAEEILTSVQYGDRSQYNKSTERTANLWYNQSEQYLMDVTDEATIETYKNNGVEYVRWMTERDDRVCDECKAMHGRIYPIDAVPTKPHRRCRCYLIPAKRE